MKKKCVVSFLLLASLVSITPVLAQDIDAPPMGMPPINAGSVRGKDSAEKPAVNKSMLPSGQTNPLYPAKYTPEYIKQIKDTYKCASKEEVTYVALDMMKGTLGEFSKNAILGNNLTQKPMKIEFKNLGQINQAYANYDALGWKRGKSLYIYINQKHSNSPAIAIAALLSHEALHQDEFNSLAEETYAWTMEAAVWTELVDLYPDYELNPDSLVERENTLKRLFIRGNYTDKYIRKTVYTNKGYQNLPESSPGFENL